MAEYMNVPYLAHRYAGKEPKRLGLAHPSIAPYGRFRAADGDILIAIQNEREWEIFCDSVLRDSTLTRDSRFDRNTARVRNRENLDAMVQETIGQYSLYDLCKVLDTAGIAYGRISTMADLAVHPSVTMATVETSEGPVQLLATPVVIDGDRPVLGRVPRLGEHTDALRSEFHPHSASTERAGLARGTP
jgi:crotonobetainyl-CoA:carnitine CoA-transferase CaiB-like acyl-CoA transferase